MTQNEVSIIKNAVLDATEAYVDARLSSADFVKTQIGIVQSYTERNHKFYHTVKCDNNRVTYTNVLSVGNIPFPANSVVFLLAPNAQFSNQFILGKLDNTPCHITAGSISIGNNFSVDSNGNMIASNANFSGSISGSAISGGSIEGSTIKIGKVREGVYNFTVGSDGSMMASKGYIGDSSYGFIIYASTAQNYAALYSYSPTGAGPTSIANYWSIGAYYGVNGIRINAGGDSTTSIIGGYIGCKDITVTKTFTLCNADPYSETLVGTINGRFVNTNKGQSTIFSPDSEHIMCSGRNGSAWVPWTTGSDRKLKENIKPIQNNFVRKIFKDIEPVEFNYISDKNKHTEYGLIAQDLEKLFKKYKSSNSSIVFDVQSNESEKTKVIDYQKLVGLLIPAVKDLYELTEKQQAQIDELIKQRKEDK